MVAFYYTGIFTGLDAKGLDWLGEQRE